MRRTFGAIAAVAGFTALASLILFFVMSPQSLQNITLPAVSGAGNLTADIGGIFSGEAPAAAMPEIAVTPPETGVTASTETPPATAEAPLNTPAPAATPTATPEDAASITEIPALAPQDLPLASATVIVTPTVPIPSSLEANIATSSVTGSANVVHTLPFTESDFSRDADWQATWGILSVTDEGYLSLAAPANSYGGTVYLKNAGAWNSYSMTATVALQSGQEFGLIARYADGSNYVMCDYTKTSAQSFAVQLVQYAHGYRIPLTDAATVAVDPAAADLSAGIQVSGNYGTCSLGGTTVTDQGMGPGRVPMATAGNGSIGFFANDATAGTSRLVIKNIAVK